MDADRLERIIDDFEKEIVEAAQTPIGFIASLAISLINSGALKFEDVEEALRQEKHLIEGLRRTGEDPRLRALVFEQLKFLLEYRLDAERRFRMEVGPWNLDDRHPDWPHFPDDPDED